MLGSDFRVVVQVDAAGEDAADDLIDLRSLLNAGSVDYLNYPEQRARLLGY